jgi:hypothetical protein
MAEEPPHRFSLREVHEASLVRCVTCGHERAQHIDRADLLDCPEPCDVYGCPCVAFVEPAKG